MKSMLLPYFAAHPFGPLKMKHSWYDDIANKRSHPRRCTRSTFLRRVLHVRVLRGSVRLEWHHRQPRPRTERAHNLAAALPTICCCWGTLLTLANLAIWPLASQIIPCCRGCITMGEGKKKRTRIYYRSSDRLWRLYGGRRLQMRIDTISGCLTQFLDNDRCRLTKGSIILTKRPIFGQYWWLNNTRFLLGLLSFRERRVTQPLTSAVGVK